MCLCVAFIFYEIRAREIQRGISEGLACTFFSLRIGLRASRFFFSDGLGDYGVRRKVDLPCLVQKKIGVGRVGECFMV